MAIVANTRLSYSQGENREDLADLIDMISPDETPLYSMLNTTKATAVKHEWTQDALATPSTTNAQLEGDQYSYGSTAAVTRVANYAQIFRKAFIVSGTQEVVDKAGQASAKAYQKAKHGAELKTDIEAAYLSNNASVAGNSTTARQSGGLRAWIATNDQLGAGGASGGFSTGTGLVVAATNGTQRAFTKALLDDAINGAYVSGGSPTIIMGSPYVKRVFSSFMADAAVAQLRTQTTSKAATLVGAVDSYISDFGTLDFVPNRQMARVGATIARNVFLIDPAKAKKAVLRPISEDKDVAKTSDGLPCVLHTEQCLHVDNEAAHAVVADVFGMTAAS